MPWNWRLLSSRMPAYALTPKAQCKPANLWPHPGISQTAYTLNSGWAMSMAAGINRRHPSRVPLSPQLTTKTAGPPARGVSKALCCAALVDTPLPALSRLSTEEAYLLKKQKANCLLLWSEAPQQQPRLHLLSGDHKGWTYLTTWAWVLRSHDRLVMQLYMVYI